MDECLLDIIYLSIVTTMDQRGLPLSKRVNAHHEYHAPK
jgi:hypothetical protein